MHNNLKNVRVIVWFELKKLSIKLDRFLEICIIYIESSCLECYQDGRWVNWMALRGLWIHCETCVATSGTSWWVWRSGFLFSLFLPQTLFEKFSVSSHSSPRGHDGVWLCTCVWACVGVCLKCCVDLSGVISDLWWSRSCRAWRCLPCAILFAERRTHKQ